MDQDDSAQRQKLLEEVEASIKEIDKAMASPFKRVVNFFRQAIGKEDSSSTRWALDLDGYLSIRWGTYDIILNADVMLKEPYKKAAPSPGQARQGEEDIPYATLS